MIFKAGRTERLQPSNRSNGLGQITFRVKMSASVAVDKGITAPLLNWAPLTLWTGSEI